MTRIVLLKDQDPLHIETTDGDVWICRCGLSKDWPYCDSSHATARREQPGKVYAHHRDEADRPLQSQVLDEVPDADPRP